MEKNHTMQTRSKSRLLQPTQISDPTPNTEIYIMIRNGSHIIPQPLCREYTVDIDFDEASQAWRENKRQTPNGTFVYRCNYVHANKKCINRCMGNMDVCYIHRNKRTGNSSSDSE